MSQLPWTWNQFHKAMIAAGWQRMPGDTVGKAYVHPDHPGSKFYPLQFWHRRERWHYFAERHETPAPDLPPF